MKKPLVFLLCFLLCASPVLAWNPAGHMVTGAIAYSDLKANHPETLKKVMAILQQHPEYNSRWEEAIKDLPDKAENHDLYIFMLAARWADDIRDNPSYNHPKWHYINYPLAFESGYPTTSENGRSSLPLDPENILNAFFRNIDEAGNNYSPKERAVALAWMFHLMGDVHQPLHATNFFSSEFPNGDKGGNDFKIIATEGGNLINLHSFWDGVVIGTENFQQVKNQATLIRNNPNLQRNKMTELKPGPQSEPPQKESFDLARDIVYEKGALKSGSTLTQAYREKAKVLGERRVALAGYRLADVLVELDGDHVFIPNSVPVPSTTPQKVSAPILGNKNSKIYHLSNCPNYNDISLQNRVPFQSEEEAQKAGYRKARNCP
jgi:hypothetical protein